jgi:hypothetical protein
VKANWPGLMTLGLFIAIVVFGSLFWVVGLVGLWLLLRSLGVSTDLWAMMEALSTAVAAAAVLSAGFVAYRELSETADSRYVEVADRLFQELNAPEAIEARRWIYRHLPADPAKGVRTIPPLGQQALKSVLNSLDRVAFLTQAGWIPYDVVLPWMHPMIAKLWTKLEPYVRYERKRRNEPYYYEHASKLAEVCAAWRAKHLPETQVNWLDDAL